MNECVTQWTAANAYSWLGTPLCWCCHLNGTAFSPGCGWGRWFRKPGVLPTHQDDGTTLTTCDGEGLQRQSLQEEAALVGMKTRRMKSSSQFGDIKTPETHEKPSSPRATSFAQSTLLTARPLAVLWEDALQGPQTTEDRRRWRHRDGFTDWPAMLQGTLHLANCGSISK